ncbi:LysR family transcriptional regulator substrate-binding protein [Streptomyces sp. NPDC054802]
MLREVRARDRAPLVVRRVDTRPRSPPSVRAGAGSGDADLADIRHIRLPENSSSRAHLDAAFAELGVRISSEPSVTDWDTAIRLAELGLGHAVVPALPNQYIHGEASPLRFIPIPDLPRLSVGWAVRRWDDLTPLARTFADTVSLSCTQKP